MNVGEKQQKKKSADFSILLIWKLIINELIN